MIIDGSHGEGGGQIFRTTLTMAVCLGQDVKIINIRAGRKKTGLLRQHLTCLHAAQAICSAEVSGDQLGSTEVLFRPKKIKADQYEFTISTAGSANLVMQTIMLPLLLLPESSTVLIHGGTHNDKAPSFEFINKSFMPQLLKMGYRMSVELCGYGFQPVGGGTIKIQTQTQTQAELMPLFLDDRGKFIGKQAYAIGSQIPDDVFSRELAILENNHNWGLDELFKRKVNSAGPGNLVSLVLKMENITTVVDEVGQRGNKAERVVRRAVNKVEAHLNQRGAVCEYLADQLLLPMIFAGGGRFTTVKPSLHLTTNIEVIQKFLNIPIELFERPSGEWQLIMKTNPKAVN